ncbi:hypothetical protein E1A91_A08G167800v1 [Gossypium mustelinum]|uniref:Uncharacterized protein n=1 Tax=Gossypium mustelinum TaxID=34275 RepID=A0A5D2YB99_GOSMU|nr:hypothetical protein E1A91_A08G167800v1 [Gossypium mustelinum]
MRNRDSMLKALNDHSYHCRIEMKKILSKISFKLSLQFYHSNTLSVFQIRRYGATDKKLLRNIHYSALEQTQIDVQTLEGQMEPEVLLAGNIDGSFSLLKVGSELHFDYGITRILDRVWPSAKGDVESDEMPPYVSRPAAAPLHMSLRISCIRLCEKQSFSTNNAHCIL